MTPIVDAYSPLEHDRNPFAVVVQAYLKAQETAQDLQNRYDWKAAIGEELAHVERSDESLKSPKKLTLVVANCQ